MNEITVFFSISLGSLPFGAPFVSSVRPFKHRVLHAPHRLLLMTVPPTECILTLYRCLLHLFKIDVFAFVAAKDFVAATLA